MIVMSPVDARDRLSRRRETMKRKAPAAAAAATMKHKMQQCSVQKNASASFEGLICPCKENFLDTIQDIPSNRLIARVVRPGMALFLFDQSVGRLHGIYQAGASEYDDKISLHIQQRCSPLEGVELENFFLENDIKPHVGPEVLTASQVSCLIDMFIDMNAEAESRHYNNGVYAEHMLKDPYPNPYARYGLYEEDMHVVENHVGDGGYLLEELSIPYTQVAAAVPHSHAMPSGWKCPPIDSTQYVTHPMKNQGRMADPTPVEVTGYQRQAHLARAPVYSPVAHLSCGEVKVRSPLDMVPGSCGQPGCGGYGQAPPFRTHHPVEISYQPSRPEVTANGYGASSAPPAQATTNNNVFHQVEGKQNRAPKQVSKQVSKLPNSVSQNSRQQRVKLAPDGHPTTTKAQATVQSKVQKRQKPTKDSSNSVFNRIKPPTVFSRLGSSSGGNDTGVCTMPVTRKACHGTFMVPEKSFRPRPPRNQAGVKVDDAGSVADTVVHEEDFVTGNVGVVEDGAFLVNFKRRVVNSNVSSAPQLKRRKIVRPEGLGCSSENVASLNGQEVQEPVVVMSQS